NIPKMNQGIDYYGIVSFDSKIVDQLKRYLREKESRLVERIFTIIQPVFDEAFPTLMPAGEPSFKLADAVEGIKKRFSLLLESSFNRIPKESVTQMRQELDAILWDYTETLEGCVIEFFQQLSLVNLEKWDDDLMQSVKRIKDILLEHIDEVIWSLKRIKQPL